MSKVLTIAELLKMANNFKITDEHREAFKKTILEAELRFEEEAKKRRVTPEMLNRTYTL